MAGSADSQRTYDDVLAAARDDARAFARLFERFAPRLRLVIQLKMGPTLRRRVDPDDILQVTFLYAWQALAGFEGSEKGAFFGWLCWIASQRVKDAGRHHNAQYQDVRREIAEEAADGDGVPLLLQLAAEISSPSSHMARREQEERLVAAVSALPDPLGTIVTMRDFEGRTYREIAEVYGKSIPWAHGQHAEALLMLGKQFGHEPSA